MPGRASLKVFQFAAIALMVTGCALTPRQTPDEAEAVDTRLSAIASALPGQYASVAGTRDGQIRRLQIETRPIQRAKVLALELMQDDGEQQRHFALTLEPGDGALNLAGQFTPLDGDGRAVGSCAMRFHLRDGGLVGMTDPTECRFGQGDQAVGLLKEIAFDGWQLVIGDQVLPAGEADENHAADIVTYLPAINFSGWAGRLEGDAWRIARDIRLRPNGLPEQPRDAADMSLEVDIRLGYYRLASDGRQLLRLSLRDRADGSLLGESWSDTSAATIGLALPNFQVGLERLPQP